MNRVIFIGFFLFIISCSGAQTSGPNENIPLGQARAIEIFESAAQSRDYGAPSHNIRARLSNDTEVNVDVLIRSIGAGFVYINEQDRRDLTGEIPPQADASQLYALRATTLTDESQIHVLVLQDTDFVYVPNPRADERLPEHRTIDDVEARMRRDSLDFMHALVDLHGGQTD